MAKLNKQEIDTLSNLAYRKISKEIEEKRNACEERKRELKNKKLKEFYKTEEGKCIKKLMDMGSKYLTIGRYGTVADNYNRILERIKYDLTKDEINNNKELYQFNLTYNIQQEIRNKIIVANIDSNIEVSLDSILEDIKKTFNL